MTAHHLPAALWTGFMRPRRGWPPPIVAVHDSRHELRLSTPLPEPGGRNPPVRGAGREGVALLLVLWAMFLLCLVVFSVARQIDQQLAMDARDGRSQQAYALAFSGLQVALHPQVMNNQTAALRGGADGAHWYLSKLTGEGGKLNLNWMTAGQDQVKLDVLRRWVDFKGLSFAERETFVDCLLDWTQPGNVVRLHGSKTDINGSPVPGRPMQDLAELRRMRGAEPLVSQADWDSDLTLLSNGPIDLQWASEAVISALPGVGQPRAQAFLRVRRGPDGIDGTADDMQIDTLTTAAQWLGMDPTAFQQSVANLIILKDPVFRIISIGQAGDVAHRIEVVALKQGGQPGAILQWKEY